MQIERIAMHQMHMCNSCQLHEFNVIFFSIVVSDAGAGGQILMCSTTFRAVQHLAEELGCVGLEGMSFSKLYSVRGALAKLSM